MTQEAPLPKDDALTVLRTETALSRFPLHRLNNGQDVQIELKNATGEVYWAIHHTTKFGPPGQLAYKIDTLIVNRRIEEGGRSVPKIIRLGTLAEIAQDVGSASHNTTAIKRALLQNATASISAKITYRAREGSERFLEAVFNRYSVVFTGEKLPTGQTADAVYLILNDIYQQILHTAVFRPLDYEYMKTLPPISQRFYEIASYQIFGALKHGNPRAKLLYSEYCLLSTATRYFDFDHVKKQMYKILRPHIRSGYLAKVEYQAVINEAGDADWIMMLTPGPQADREFRANTGQKQTRKIKPKTNKGEETLALPPGKSGNAPTRVPKGSLDNAKALTAPVAAVEAGDPQLQELIAALVGADLNRSDAVRFAAQCPDVCRRQLLFLPFVDTFKTSRGAYLRRAIEDDYAPPAAYLRAKQQEEAQRSAQARRAKERAREDEQQAHQRELLDALLEQVALVKTGAPKAFAAFLRRVEAEREAFLKTPAARRANAQSRALLCQAYEMPGKRLHIFLDCFAPGTDGEALLSMSAKGRRVAKWIAKHAQSVRPLLDRALFPEDARELLR